MAETNKIVQTAACRRFPWATGREYSSASRFYHRMLIFLQKNGEAMQNKYDAMRADIMKGDMEASSVMQKTPVETVKSILSRIGVDFTEGLPKETYIAAFKEEFCNNNEWILKMIPRHFLEFLLSVWEKTEIEISLEEWDYLEYLKIFGLATFKKGNPITDEPNVIYCVQEMKDRFYFLLKSKKSRMLMEQYEEWEKIICGFMYYYGMAEVTVLHEQFMKVTKRMLPFEEFLTFLKCRCSLWSFGLFLRDIQKQKDFYQCVHVENPEILLMYIQQYKDLPYKTIEKEDLFYVSEAAGIDNRWKGISELGTLFLDEMQMNYYRATVMVKTLLLMIQNGCEWSDLKEKMAVLPFESDEVRENVYDAVKLLYENAPLYELKGYSRKEYEKMFRQKQLKKKREMFTIINGRKRD